MWLNDFAVKYRRDWD